MTGIDGSAEHNQLVDGKSLVPIFKDSNHTLDRDLFWHYPHYHPGGATPHSAIRSGSYRLVEFFEEGNIELYNLTEDVGEANDLSQVNPKLAQTLQKKLAAWRSSVEAQLPTENPNFRKK